MHKKAPNDNNNYDHNSTGETEPDPEFPLRQMAEAKIQAGKELLPEVDDPENVHRIVHELRVHQIELEIQNEELRRFQQELEASKNRFKDLYDFAPVGYVTVSQTGLIIEANRTAATLFSVTPGSLVGQPLSRFIMPDDQDIYYHHRAAIVETAELHNCKLRLLRTDRQPFWARLETAPAGDGGQDQSACRIMLSDISDGVRLAEEKTQLEGQYQQLQKAESLGRMAGAIAHHFNNLLGVVMGNLEFAISDFPEGTSARKNVTSAIKAARRAAEVSGSMLTYLGQTLGKHEPLDLSATCHTSLARLREDMPKDVDMVVDFTSYGPPVNANAYQVQQVLKNLVTNAWEARDDGRGTIHLNVKTVAALDIPATHRFPVDWQPHDRLYGCLTVTDTGCGIDAADIKKIFDPFFTSKFLGRGLGLSSVLGIVRAHGGVVTVTSKVGRGSVISVFLPVCAEVISQMPDRTIKTQEITEGGTVLVVDDEPMLREIAQFTLTSLGYTVLVAEDGIKAVEMFRQHRESIDCVLCDLVMPRMDGWETLSALRRLAPDLPVILSSGYDQVQVMAGDHSDLPQYFLGKPYGLAALHEVIRQALANNGKEQPAERQEEQQAVENFSSIKLLP